MQTILQQHNIQHTHCPLAPILSLCYFYCAILPLDIRKRLWNVRIFHCHLHFSFGQTVTEQAKNQIAKLFAMSLEPSGSKSTAIRAKHNFGQYKMVCVRMWMCQKNGKSSLGLIRSERFHWNHKLGAHNNRIGIFELRQLCRIDIYMPIYSCHGNHNGVPNVVFLITML